jgi:hypothetical protein
MQGIADFGFILIFLWCTFGSMVCVNRSLPSCRRKWRDDIDHQLVAGPVMCFKLFQISDQLPQHYRLATLQDVIEHLEDVLKALPGREIANLADGSLDEDFYSEHVTRLVIHHAFG